MNKQRLRRSMLTAAVSMLLVVSGCADTNSRGSYNAEPSRLIADKRVKNAELFSMGKNIATHGRYVSEKNRPTTQRDSGRNEALLFAKNTIFRFTGGIGFYLPEFAASLIPNDPAMPVVFDDPQSFSIKVLSGDAVLSGSALTALLDDHTFNFNGATVRNLVVKTSANKLTLSGNMIRRGKWVPFMMVGNISLHDGHMLHYTPDTIGVDNQSATAVLKAANVELDELLKLKAPGVVLKNSTIYLDTLKLYPPPKLAFKIAKAKLENRGLVLTFASEHNPLFPEIDGKMDSGIILKGGDVKFLRAMPVNAQVKLLNMDADGDLDFCLYDYRDQLTAGYLNFLEDGSIIAHIKNYNRLNQDTEE